MKYEYREPRLVTQLMGLPTAKYEPTTVNGWMRQFGTTIQAHIKYAIFNREIEAVYDVLKRIENNPFPFDLDTLKAYRDAHIKRFMGDVDEL